MQYGVVIGRREFTIHVHRTRQAGGYRWEASIADWKNQRIMPELFIGDTEQLAAYLAWLEIADRYGTPDTHPPGVSDLTPEPTDEDRRRAADAIEQALFGDDDEPES